MLSELPLYLLHREEMIDVSEIHNYLIVYIKQKALKQYAAAEL